MKLFENINIFLKQLNPRTEQAIARIMLSKSMTVSTAESCTGGLVSSRLTDIAGSSSYIKENYVTYANEAKMKILHVSEETLNNQGAVSEECAREMVNGLMAQTNCDICLATTGIAGPGGATINKRVGLMYIAIKNKYATKVKKIELNPNHSRKAMKFYFSQEALDFLLEFLKETNIDCSKIQFFKDDLCPDSSSEELISEESQEEDFTVDEITPSENNDEEDNPQED